MRRLVVGGAFFLFMLGVVGAEIVNEECMECHSDAELTNEAGQSMLIDPAHLDGSVHEGYTCVDCHTSIKELPHTEGGLPKTDCQVCHEEAQEVFATSAHGIALARGDKDVPDCADCHGSHGILAVDDTKSAVFHQNLVYTCARCHANTTMTETHKFSVNKPVEAYWQSTHFRNIADTKKHYADCVDCHGSHGLKAASDPESSIFWRNIPQTCGKCHSDIQNTYQASIHGKAVARGVRQSPVCTDCHGEHEIRGPKDPKSLVHPEHVSKTTCVWCHESVRVTQKFGLAQGRMQTYLDSYHGLANHGGSAVVANCASCHGVHDILPSTDPASMVHKDRLAETCGKCHPGVSNLVALGSVHVNMTYENGGTQITDYVRQFYMLLILATIGFMLMHNGLDLARNFRLREGLPDGHDFLRFTVSERLQHATMALSFMVLAYSGFALQFPNVWWAGPFSWLSESEEFRRLIHRVAAVVMVSVCAFHAVYLVVTKRGRQQLMAMAPKVRDIRDFGQMVKYYLRRTDKQPRFARFSYIEKLEYWALAWGSVVMTVTGFALWFANISLRFAPKWVLDVATVIHYYEAWLAVLAIIVWHFYWVIYNPRVYPMSLVWLTGRMSKKAMEHEHPEELEETNRQTDK
ncbi:MAG: formate dehydrogenase gamma subunit [Candidatus Latescibacterota bacterium]|jgi:formate dehydrogenase gamma subunit